MPLPFSFHPNMCFEEKGFGLWVRGGQKSELLWKKKKKERKIRGRSKRSGMSDR